MLFTAHSILKVKKKFLKKNAVPSLNLPDSTLHLEINSSDEESSIDIPVTTLPHNMNAMNWQGTSAAVDCPDVFSTQQLQVRTPDNILFNS
jgi:hypothetical protein